MLALAIFCAVINTVILILNIKMLKDNVNYVKQYNEDNPRRLLERAKASEIQDDISHYVLNKGLKCMILPDSNNNTTIFTVDKNDSLIPICPIPMTDKKSDSEEYQYLFKEAIKRIETFIKDNKDVLDVKN
jgi:hypothetical protein